jgi:gliding motility-associated transport system ATP-binding protein
MIEVEHLTKRYDRKAAVEDVTFRVEKGEVLGFLGPNGAGKTTTMRAITGYVPATEGRIRVNGFDVQEQPLEVRRSIGYLPENPPLYPEMTVAGYLRFVARIKGVDRADLDTEVGRVMGKVDVADVSHRIVGKLSKGYRQRVGLAQALLKDPPVLILDEPTIGLDPKQIHEVRDLIREWSGRHTVILSTHILPEVEQTCSRVVIISGGHIVAVDTPANLVEQLRGADRTVLAVKGPEDEVRKRLKGLPGVLDVRDQGRGSGQDSGISDQAAAASGCRFEVETRTDDDPRPRLARTVVEAGWDLLEMRSSTMSLEDVFLELTTQDDVHAKGSPEGTRTPVPE